MRLDFFVSSGEAVNNNRPASAIQCREASVMCFPPAFLCRVGQHTSRSTSSPAVFAVFHAATKCPSLIRRSPPILQVLDVLKECSSPYSDIEIAHHHVDLSESGMIRQQPPPLHRPRERLAPEIGAPYPAASVARISVSSEEVPDLQDKPFLRSRLALSGPPVRAASAKSEIVMRAIR